MVINQNGMVFKTYKKNQWLLILQLEIFSKIVKNVGWEQCAPSEQVMSQNAECIRWLIRDKFRSTLMLKTLAL